MPNPWHAAHGCVVMTWPRNERATRCTVPRPWHTSQVRGDVPGRQQEPWHVGHRTAVSTCDLAVHAERDLGEVEVEPHERVLTAPRARDGPTLRRGTGRGAEEGLEDVLEPETAAHAATGRRRVRADVVGAALLRVAEHLVGARDVLEPVLGRGVVARDVRVVLTGELAVGLLDLLGRRVARDTEDLVVVVAHEVVCSLPGGLVGRSGRRGVGVCVVADVLGRRGRGEAVRRVTRRGCG